MISPGSPRDKPSSPRPRLPPQPDINATSNNRQQLSGIPRLSGGPRIPGHVQDWLNELATFSQFGSPNLSQAPIADLATLQQQLDAMDLARTEGQVPQQATDSTTQTYIAAAPAPSVNVQPPAPTTELSGAALLQLLQAQWAQQVPAPAPPQVNEHGARAQQALHQRMQQTAANQAGLPPANRPIWGAAPSTAYMPQVQVPVPPMVWPTIVQASQATYRQPLTSVEQLHVKVRPT